MNQVEKIDYLLEKSGWSKAHFSLISGIDYTVLTNIRAGRRNIGIKTAYVMAAAFGVSVLEILEPDGLPPENIREFFNEVKERRQKLRRMCK